MGQLSAIRGGGRPLKIIGRHYDKTMQPHFARGNAFPPLSAGGTTFTPGGRHNKTLRGCNLICSSKQSRGCSATACGGSPAQRARGRRAERALPADRYLQADETLSSCTRILPCVQNDHVRREGNPVTSCFPLRGIPARRERVYEAARDIDTLSWYGTAVRRHFYSSPPKAAIHNPQPPKAVVKPKNLRPRSRCQS